MSGAASMIASAKLTRQRYGIAMAQNNFGGPRGIWLECRSCNESQVIIGSNSDEWMALSDAQVAKVFRRHGWTGIGPKMLRAKCPSCASKPLASTLSGMGEE